MNPGAVPPHSNYRREPVGQPFKPRPKRRRWLEWCRHLLLLCMICILPFSAGVALSLYVDELQISLYFSAISLITYLFYWRDKRHAQTGMWRTPETTLHFLELAGGWPAAFLAQRILRHKILKKSYQIKFWMIVVLHQALAYDSFLGWRWVRLGYAWMKIIVNRVLFGEALV